MIVLESWGTDLFQSYVWIVGVVVVIGERLDVGEHSHRDPVVLLIRFIILVQVILFQIVFGVSMGRLQSVTQKQRG